MTACRAFHRIESMLFATDPDQARQQASDYVRHAMPVRRQEAGVPQPASDLLVLQLPVGARRS